MACFHAWLCNDILFRDEYFFAIFLSLEQDTNREPSDNEANGLPLSYRRWSCYSGKLRS
jgi:hypothetical protein